MQPHWSGRGAFGQRKSGPVGPLSRLVRCCGLEDRDDGALVGLVDEVAHGIGLQGLGQSLDLLGILVAVLDDQHVGVGLGGQGVGGLDGQGVLLDGQAGGLGVVAVDAGDVDILQGIGDVGGLKLLDLQVLGGSRRCPWR